MGWNAPMIHLLVKLQHRKRLLREFGTVNSNVAAGGSVCLLFHRHVFGVVKIGLKGGTVRWKTTLGPRLCFGPVCSLVLVPLYPVRDFATSRIVYVLWMTLGGGCFFDFKFIEPSLGACGMALR